MLLEDIECENLSYIIDEIIKWLHRKATNNGTYISGTPPNIYTITNLRIYEYLYTYNKKHENINIKRIIYNLDKFLEKQLLNDYDIAISPNIKNEREFFKDETYYKFYKLKLLSSYSIYLTLKGNNSKNIINYILKLSDEKNLWFNYTGYDVPILIDIVKYYRLSNDESIKNELKSLVKSLSKRQLSNGTFRDDDGYSISLYADAACIYKTFNMDEEFKRTINLITKYDKRKILEDYPLNRISYTYYILSTCINETFAKNLLYEIIK